MIATHRQTDRQPDTEYWSAIERARERYIHAIKISITIDKPHEMQFFGRNAL